MQYDPTLERLMNVVIDDLTAIYLYAALIRRTPYDLNMQEQILESIQHTARHAARRLQDYMYDPET